MIKEVGGEKIGLYQLLLFLDVISFLVILLLLVEKKEKRKKGVLHSRSKFFHLTGSKEFFFTASIRQN